MGQRTCNDCEHSRDPADASRDRPCPRRLPRSYAICGSMSQLLTVISLFCRRTAALRVRPVPASERAARLVCAAVPEGVVAVDVCACVCITAPGSRLVLARYQADRHDDPGRPAARPGSACRGSPVAHRTLSATAGAYTNGRACKVHRVRCSLPCDWFCMRHCFSALQRVGKNIAAVLRDDHLCCLQDGHWPIPSHNQVH